MSDMEKIEKLEAEKEKQPEPKHEPACLGYICTCAKKS